MQARLFALFLAVVVVSPPRGAAAENRIRSLAVRADGGTATVVVEGSEPPTFATGSDEERLVIDLAAATLVGVAPETPGAGPVRAVRARRFGTVVRLVVEVEPGAEADVAVHENRLVVEVARHFPVALVAPAAAARLAAERIAREEAERLARLEAERKAREEADRLARLEAERKAGEEADRLARLEAERKAREEADRLARLEAERKAGEEADRFARLEAERKAREEAERLARLEAERKAREEADRLARLEAERKAREEVDRLARLEADRQAREEAARRARLEADRQAREEAEGLARAAAAGTRTAPPGPQEITHVGFRLVPGGARVVVRTAEAPRYRIEPREGGVVLVLPGGRIPLANYRRAIDASFFGTRVGTIRPVIDPRADEVRIEVGVRGSAGPVVQLGDQEVALEFAGEG